MKLLDDVKNDLYHLTSLNKEAKARIIKKNLISVKFRAFVHKNTSTQVPGYVEPGQACQRRAGCLCKTWTRRRVSARPGHLSSRGRDEEATARH